MSKTYKCRVKKDITETHRVSDEIEYKIRLLDILDKEDMAEEYEKVLKDMGGKKKKDGNLEIEIDGVKITIDVKKQNVKAKVDEKEKISENVDKELEIYDYDYNENIAHKKAEEIIEKDIKEKINKRKAEHEVKVREKLEKAEEKIKEKLREATNETHKRALRRKADSMGKVIVDQENKLKNGDNQLVLEVEIG